MMMMKDDSLYIYIYVIHSHDGCVERLRMFEIDVLMANIDASIYFLPLLHHEITTNKCEDKMFKINKNTKI